MMFLPLLVSVLMHIALASECPSPVKMYVSQDSILPRPAGEVVLTCVVTGLGDDEVEALWWTNKEENPPREILSDSTIMDAPHLTRDDFDSSSRTESLLRLNISMGNRFSYSCKLVTHKGVSCSKRMQVRFKDPTIEIVFDRGASPYDNVNRTLLINVTCIVDASYGTPQIVLSYFGSEGPKVELREQDTVTNHNKYYFQGSHWAVLQLPTTGSVYCRVIDERGVYGATRPITTFTSVCPDFVTIKVRQPRLAARPNDTITMECSVVGVSSGDVEFYMWTIEETNQPVYIFSEIHKIDEINEDYQAHVLQQEHTLTNDGISSIITLNVDVTNRNTYKCDVKVRDKNCIDLAPVMFQDPKLDLKFDKYPMHADELPTGTVTQIICKIDVASGEPQFTLTYQGEKEQSYKLIAIEPDITNHTFYFSAQFIATVRLPDAGKVICSITDSITTYEISKEIFPRLRELYLGKSEKFSNTSVILITCISSLAILIVLDMILLKLVMVKAVYGTNSGFPLLRNREGELIAEEHKGFPWKWSRITTMSRDPGLYAEHEPLCSDIQQVNCAAYDSWILAALNSLCVSNSRDPSNNYFAMNFKKVKNLTDSTIPIMIWRFGEWKEVQVTPTLPSIGGKPYFVHSENKHVFWSALLQKVFGMIRHASSNMDDERHIHVMEDLSGETVVTHASKYWYDLCSYIMAHRPICCRIKVEGVNIYYSITGLRREPEITGEDQIKLREFPYIYEKVQTKYSFPREKITSCEENDEFFIRKTVFQQYFSEYDVLASETIYQEGQAVKMLEYTDFDSKGRWRQTRSDLDYTRDSFWTNPQYLFEIDGSQVPEGQAIHVRILLMQKERWPADFNTTYHGDPLFPLRIGIKMFELDSASNPTASLENYSTALKSSHISNPTVVTRTVECWLSVKSRDRFLMVPLAEGGQTPCEFLLRIHTNNKDALRFKLLPGNEEEDYNSPLLFTSHSAIALMP